MRPSRLAPGEPQASRGQAHPGLRLLCGALLAAGIVCLLVLGAGAASAQQPEPGEISLTFQAEDEVDAEWNVSFSQERSQELYERFDRDGNGSISAEEADELGDWVRENWAMDALRTRVSGSPPGPSPLVGVQLEVVEGPIDPEEPIEAQAGYRWTYPVDHTAPEHVFEVLAGEGQASHAFGLSAPPAFAIADHEGLEQAQVQDGRLTGERSVDTPVTVGFERVYEPPTITVEEPEPDETVALGETVTFRGTATTDESLGVRGVGMSTTERGSSSIRPGENWSATWTPEEAIGNTTVTLRVTDTAEQIAEEEVPLRIVDPAATAEGEEQEDAAIPDLGTLALTATVGSAALLRRR